MDAKRLSLEEFELVVEAALAEIPDALWNKIANVAVVVEEWPTPHQLASVGMRSGGLLLGLYEGVPLTERTHHYGLVPPDKITIFRGPILRVCPPEEAAIRMSAHNKSIVIFRTGIPALGLALFLLEYLLRGGMRDASNHS